MSRSADKRQVIEAGVDDQEANLEEWEWTVDQGGLGDIAGLYEPDPDEPLRWEDSWCHSDPRPAWCECVGCLARRSGWRQEYESDSSSIGNSALSPRKNGCKKIDRFWLYDYRIDIWSWNMSEGVIVDGRPTKLLQNKPAATYVVDGTREGLLYFGDDAGCVDKARKAAEVMVRKLYAEQ